MKNFISQFTAMLLFLLPAVTSKIAISDNELSCDYEILYSFSVDINHREDATEVDQPRSIHPNYIGQFVDEYGRVAYVVVNNNSLFVAQGGISVSFAYALDYIDDGIAASVFTNDQYGNAFLDKANGWIIVANVRFVNINGMPGTYNSYQSPSSSYSTTKSICNICNGTGRKCVLKTVPTYGYDSGKETRCNNCQQWLQAGIVHTITRCTNCNVTVYI